VKISEDIQMDLDIVPTQIKWRKLRTNHGEFTQLIVSTTVGSWCFWMPPAMVKDLRVGMQEMESPLTIAKTVPPSPGNGSRL